MQENTSLESTCRLPGTRCRVGPSANVVVRIRAGIVAIQSKHSCICRVVPITATDRQRLNISRCFPFTPSVLGSLFGPFGLNPTAYQAAQFINHATQREIAMLGGFLALFLRWL